jgi:hypothetical protein
MAGVVHIPWYATVFRGDRFTEAVGEIAPVSLRYGATSYSVYRSRDDLYKVLQMAAFEEKDAFEAYWYGPEFTRWRADHASWFQVPIVYAWHDLVFHGALADEPDRLVGGTVEGDSFDAR